MKAAGVLALVAAAVAVAYLVGAKDPEPPVSRTAQADARVHDLLHRVVALEEHVRKLEARLSTVPSAPETPAPVAEEDPAPAKKEQPKETDEQFRKKWEQRVLDAPAGARRLAMIRDGHAQLKAHASREEVRRFYEYVMRIVDPASEEGMEATLQMGHLYRGDKDYELSDEHYRQVERVAGSGTKRYAEAVFQLAWNEEFKGNPGGARTEFERALAAPDIDPGTAAAARFALARLKRESGDLEGGKAELQRLVDSARDHPGHGGLLYYVNLAKQQLAALK